MQSATPSPRPAAPGPDGRDTRWHAHRERRRAELVDAAIRAIRRHGATVGMDEIAAEAGTSKTVVYRHLGDRLGLYLAVCDAVDRIILRDLDKAIDAGGPDLVGDQVSAVAAVIDSYLRLVERDPELYRFVVRRPLADVDPEADPVAGLTDAIAARLQTILLAAMTHPDPEAARIWGHGLVGFVREAADRWLSEPDRIPRDDIVGHLARFAGAGITGILQSTSHR